MSDIVDTAHIASSPVAYSLGGMVYLGLPLNDWIILGTLVLVVLNITWAGVKLYDRFKKNK